MTQPRRQLNLLDVICINVGIVIGAGIFESTPFIASNTSGPVYLIALWITGGVAALLGALCYAELTTTLPRHGGEYAFLSEAYGKNAGFLFAWADFWIIRPGNIGSMAFVFANYFQQLCGITPTIQTTLVCALGSLAALTATNLLGVQMGKWTQNLLTLTKLLGIAIIIVTGLLLLPAANVGGAVLEPPTPQSLSAHSLAMILIMFSYGGWNEMSNVAAEMHNPRRTIVWGLVGSAVTVAAVYVLANIAFIRALGFNGMVHSTAVATDVMAIRFGSPGRILISLLICVSSLGAMNGTLFTGPRIYYALGCDHGVFRWLGQWNVSLGVPARALLLLSIVTASMLAVFGVYPNGFSRLVEFTAPVFWGFFFFVSIAVFVLRRRPCETEPYRVPGGPIVPAIFCLMSAGMTYTGIRRAIEVRAWEAVWSVGILTIGLALVLYWWYRQAGKNGLPSKVRNL
ncbi:MAG: amino acid permease [Planctomycetes bacterium]|nr:amino acid permease [Planctomycetota bacterium]